jgi:hypothetical protein
MTGCFFDDDELVREAASSTSAADLRIEEVPNRRATEDCLSGSAANAPRPYRRPTC